MKARLEDGFFLVSFLVQLEQEKVKDRLHSTLNLFPVEREG